MRDTIVRLGHWQYGEDNGFDTTIGGNNGTALGVICIASSICPA